MAGCVDTKDRILEFGYFVFANFFSPFFSLILLVEGFELVSVCYPKGT